MSRKEREEARKEVAVLAQLQHPNIVMYKESFEEIGNLYIVMDYCDGGDLYGRINSQRGILFPEDQILDWFVQCCLAIKHIHDRKILHRDIKSQNIFLTRHGIVKLGDFGIAKVLNSTVELARTCIGTPYYLSPEICENKPYNNKSDIWSLGCVLYELTTLKHAFEAGNMKNLVLKIIRGSYPPPSPRYTYELRGLINVLFKRSPRERPSITNVLRKPILQTRIKKFLSESEMADEFSHTVMHGVKIKKQLPSGVGRPLPPRPVSAKKAPSPAPSPRYDPSSVYGPSVARKSKDNINQNKKSAEGVRKSGGPSKRPSSGNRAPSPGAAAFHQQDLARRKQELLDKEKKRRSEEAKKREQNYAKQHKDLIDKQKQARINKAREEGWKSLISSLDSEEGDRKPYYNKRPPPAPRKAADLNVPPHEPAPRLKPSPAPAARPSDSPAGGRDFVPLPERGNYDQYHDWLDKLNEQRQAAVSGRGDGPRVPEPAPRPTPAVPRPALGVAGALGYMEAPAVPAPKPSPAVPSPRQAANFDPAHFARMGQAAGARAAEAAEQARAKEEFMARKREAALNKARAQGDIYGRGVGVAGAVSPGMRKNKPPSGKPPSGARREEEDYLAKLRQIRLQNFNERRALKDKNVGKVDPKYKPHQEAKNESELRKKKIEALRAQADDRARRLKEELEKKRKEAYELEQKRLNLQRGGKPSTPAKPPVPMTEAMKAIGAVKEPQVPVIKPVKPAVGMTAAMEAIGVNPEPSTVQQRKKEILERLNKNKPPAAADKPEVAQRPEVAQKPEIAQKPDRPKWGAPGTVVLSSDSGADRPKWGAGKKDDNLSNLRLEETASNMEATSARDVVVKHENDPGEDEAAPSSRRQWGGPPGTVLKALQGIELSPGSTISSSGEAPPVTETGTATTGAGKGETITIKSADAAAAESKGGKAPAVGSTITIARNPKGTVVIKKADTPETVSEDAELLSAPSSPAKAPVSRSPSSSPKKSSPHKTSPKDSDREPSPESSPKDGDKVATSKLFDKVELDEEDDGKEANDLKMEDVDDSDVKDVKEVKLEEAASAKPEKKIKSRLNKKEMSGTLAMGLTTGHFDVDVKMLRTCSEPDLSKLFRTMAAEEAPVSKDDLSASADIADLEQALSQQLKDAGEGDSDPEDENETDLPEVDKEPEIGVTSGSPSESQEGSGSGSAATSGGEKDDEEDDGQDESDDSDLQTMRESMMSLLENNEEVSDEEPLSATAKKSKKKTTKKTGKTTKKGIKKKKKVKEEDGMPVKGNWSSSSVEDFRSMRETMKTLLQPDTGLKRKSTLKPVAEAGAGDAAATGSNTENSTDPPTIIPGRESWQSDDEEEDDYFEEEDMFSRLEESRVKLEEQLGCDTFMKAYKAVQEQCRSAIHEDEDDGIVEGSKIVFNILGDQKSHLYDSILQLVMADGAFTEDND